MKPDNPGRVPAWIAIASLSVLLLGSVLLRNRTDIGFYAFWVAIAALGTFWIVLDWRTK
jgi:hypothetical protein